MTCYFNTGKQIQVYLSSIITVGSYSLVGIVSKGGKGSTELHLAYWGLNLPCLLYFQEHLSLQTGLCH